MKTKVPQLKGTYVHNALFGPGQHAQLNACVGKNGGPYDFADYARGYFEASERLARSILENSFMMDVIIYPLAFSYRHALELSLKDLSIQLPKFWDETVAVKLTHNLYDNWNQIKPYLKREKELDPEANLISQIDSILADFLEIDPRGETFRYPQARDGTQHLQNTSLINVVVFVEAMNTVQNAFEYWMDRIRELLEYKWEMEREHSR